MKKLLLVLALLLAAGLALLLAAGLALLLWHTGAPPRPGRSGAVLLVRKSPLAVPSPKRVRAVHALTAVHSR